MTAGRPTALIADDEPLLRASLARLLAEAWPELEVVAQARNGREAVAMFGSLRPDVCFLDVHMPGLSGVEAARAINSDQAGQRAHLVFVTAFVEYAVQAFEQGALDYLVKPVEPARLADTVARLRERMHAAQPAAANMDALLDQLAARLRKDSAPAPLQWLRASVGQALRMIPVEEVDYLRSDEKYTLIAWRGDGGKPGEALVRTALKDLVAQLDGTHFVQVHRSVVVNLRSISHVVRGDNETAQVHLRGRPEVLPVSRSYLHHFKQM
jgi:DNA-binding LytR/AlgR family response regulator